MNSPRKIFLTGITGGLGRELLREILKTKEDHLYVLVRGNKKSSSEERIRKILFTIGFEDQLGQRVHALEGDVTLPFLGLTETDRLRLRTVIDVFYHIAALTALNGSEADCNLINVGGTANALALAEDWRKHGKLKRFVYFSTAYVAGSRQTYRSLEDELPVSPVFANFY